MSNSSDELNKILERYAIDDKWRAAWLAKSAKPDYGRLCSTQEYIDRRAQRANTRIGELFRQIDHIVQNTGEQL